MRRCGDAEKWRSEEAEWRKGKKCRGLRAGAAERQLVKCPKSWGGDNFGGVTAPLVGEQAAVGKRADECGSESDGRGGQQSKGRHACGTIGLFLTRPVLVMCTVFF